MSVPIRPSDKIAEILRHRRHLTECLSTQRALVNATVGWRVLSEEAAERTLKYIKQLRADIHDLDIALEATK